MQSISVYKNIAANALSGNWGKCALATLIYFIIMELPSWLAMPNSELYSYSYSGYSGYSLLYIVFVICLMPLTWGFHVFFLKICRDENPGMGFMFSGFSGGRYLKLLGTLLLMAVYELLWLLCLVIPGIVKSYSYSMTYFIMNDNPDICYDAAITESSRMMRGHKMQLFLLDLSMIGWGFLSVLTLGIGFLFLVPYNYTAHAAFYEELKAEQPAAEIEFTV